MSEAKNKTEHIFVVYVGPTKLVGGKKGHTYYVLDGFETEQRQLGQRMHFVRKPKDVIAGTVIKIQAEYDDTGERVDSLWFGTAQPWTSLANDEKFEATVAGWRAIEIAEHTKKLRMKEAKADAIAPHVKALRESYKRLNASQQKAFLAYILRTVTS